MDVGDPLTEAVCWDAAWRMVTAGSLAGGDFAGLVTRRLGAGAPLPVAGVEVLLERAVTAASRYSPDAERAGFRERYFAEAVPVLDGRDVRTMRRLARALYPATLAEPATLAATAAALERGGLSEGLRLVLREREAILRAARAARSVPRRWG
jgi:hypothetical protein